MKISGNLLDLTALFGTKVGGILVGLIVLPLYHRMLTPTAFGVVAVVISLQAFFSVFDLGTSTLLGRDVAAHYGDVQRRPGLLKTWRDTELLLAVFYAAGLLSTCIYWFISSPHYLGIGILIGSVLLLWLLAIQNLSQILLVSARHYKTASLFQFLGVTIRAVVTLFLLYVFGAKLEVFIVSQITTALAHVILIRFFGNRCLGVSGFLLTFARPVFLNAFQLLGRSKSLVLFGAAGAAAMQLDKPIISLQLSVAVLGPYFLASTYALTPVAVLAGPIAQFFQPKIFALQDRSNDEISSEIRRFSGTLLVALFAPVATLWLFCPEWMAIWLHSTSINETAALARILLIAGTVGALGYIPNVLLVGRQDFWFLARFSTLLTILLLPSLALGATFGSISTIAWIYVGYHSSSTAVLWLRAYALPESRLSTRQAFYTGIYNSAILAICIFIGYEVTLLWPHSWITKWAFACITSILSLLATYFLITQPRHHFIAAS